MRKLIIIISLFTLIPLSQISAQKGFYVGAGGGLTFYYGSISQKENLGYTGGINGMYQFNNQVGVGLSYNYNTLQASRTLNTTEYHFDGTLSSIDFHIYADLIGIIRNSSDYSPVKAKIDLGAGLISYDATAYLNGIEDKVHFDAPPSQGSSYKLHFGGELDYNITSNISAYISLLGNYCMTSDVDAYAYYTKNGIARSPTKNDFYYTTMIGARYYFETTGFSRGGGRSRTSRSSNSIGFGRFTGKQTAKQSFFTNNRTKNTNTRYEGKKKIKPRTALQPRATRNARTTKVRRSSSYQRYSNNSRKK